MSFFSWFTTSLPSWFKKVFIGGTISSGGQERPSSSDIVKTGHIAANEWFVTIDLHDALPLSEKPIVWLPHTPESGSMDPVMDFGHNALYLWAANERDERSLLDWLWNQEVGNLVVYRIPADVSQPAIAYNAHRIVKKGIDAEGRYYLFKGDNNAVQDPWKVREINLKYLCFGIIY